MSPGSDITAARFVSLSELAGFDLPQFTADVIRRAWEQKQQGSLFALNGNLRAGNPLSLHKLGHRL